MPPVTKTQERMLEQFFIDSIKHHKDYPVVVSEGDSWFSFPGHANTIDHLDAMAKRRMSLLRLETSGDTLHNMVRGEQRAKLRRLLSNYPVDALLFSGGGNDVVGPELIDFFDYVPDGRSWRDYVRQDALDTRIEEVKIAYTGLKQLRDQYRPKCVIVTHGYDYARPSGKPTEYWLWPIPVSVTVGPWIQNSLRARNINAARDQQEVVNLLIDRFNEALATLADAKFIVLDNRNVLAKAEWSDELHPTRAGFRKIAKTFYDAVKTTVPKGAKAWT
jgi:hypothetical protein